MFIKALLKFFETLSSLKFGDLLLTSYSMKEILYESLTMNGLKVARKVRPVDFNPFLSNFPILYPLKTPEICTLPLYLKYLNFIRFLKVHERYMSIYSP